MTRATEILIAAAALVVVIGGLVYIGDHTTVFNFLGFKGVVVH